MRKLRVLILGFGSFPGVRFNPSAEFVASTARRLHSVSRLSVKAEVLPVSWRRISSSVADAMTTPPPDAVFMFGVANSRRAFCVETRAFNRRSTYRADGEGHRANLRPEEQFGPSVSKARAPTAQIAAALRLRGLPVRLSNNAGDYLCNAAFYHALAHDPILVAFVHLPGMRGAATPSARVCGRLARPTVARSAIVVADALRALVCESGLRQRDWQGGARWG